MEDLKLLEKDMQEVKKKLAAVHDAIVGNALTKDGGIAQRLTEAEMKIEQLETRLESAEKKQIRYNVYTIIMWVSLGGAAGMAFAYLMSVIFKR